MEKKYIFTIAIVSVIVGASVVGGILIFSGTGELVVEIHDKSKVATGTTLFADLNDESNPRIVEVDMNGVVVWEYVLPNDLKTYINPGMDVERLPNDNILFVAPLKGVYEIDREGNIIWYYLDAKVSHDADRLPNGNTIIIWGGADEKTDPQVKEVNKNGDIVWSWYAGTHYDRPPYENIVHQGWTHANSVTRLSNGNTMINLRNFNLTVFVNFAGEVVREVDWSEKGDDPHEPEILPNGNLLIALQGDIDYQAVELNMDTGDVAWQYGREGLNFNRDTDRLSNGNTLITAVVDGSAKIFEITADGEIVWQLTTKGKTLDRYGPGWFFNAQRIES